MDYSGGSRWCSTHRSSWLKTQHIQRSCNLGDETVAMRIAQMHFTQNLALTNSGLDASNKVMLCVGVPIVHFNQKGLVHISVAQHIQVDLKWLKHGFLIIHNGFCFVNNNPICVHHGVSMRAVLSVIR